MGNTPPALNSKLGNKPVGPPMSTSLCPPSRQSPPPAFPIPHSQHNPTLDHHLPNRRPAIPLHSPCPLLHPPNVLYVQSPTRKSPPRPILGLVLDKRLCSCCPCPRQHHLLFAPRKQCQWPAHITHCIAKQSKGKGQSIEVITLAASCLRIFRV